MSKRFVVQIKTRKGKWRSLRPRWAKRANPPYTLGYKRARGLLALMKARQPWRKFRIRAFESNRQRRDRLINTWVIGNTTNISPTLVYKIALTARHVGKPFRIHSGWRSPEKQAELYQKFLNGTGAPANPPGMSLHERTPALAVDGSIGGVNFWHAPGVKTYAISIGLRQPYNHEPWHIE